MIDYDNEINLNDDIIKKKTYVWVLIGTNILKNGEEIYSIFNSKQKAVNFNKKHLDNKCRIEKHSVN